MLQVDPLENGRHLGGRDLDPIALGHWEAEDSAFQALRPDRQTITVPVEDLEPVSATIPEYKESPDKIPLSWQTLSGGIQRGLRSQTPGRYWN